MSKKDELIAVMLPRDDVERFVETGGCQSDQQNTDLELEVE